MRVDLPSFLSLCTISRSQFFFKENNNKTKNTPRYFAAPLNLALRLSVAIISSSVVIIIIVRWKNKARDATRRWTEREKESLRCNYPRAQPPLLCHQYNFLTPYPLSTELLVVSESPLWNTKPSRFIEDFSSPACKWLLSRGWNRVQTATLSFKFI